MTIMVVAGQDGALLSSVELIQISHWAPTRLFQPDWEESQFPPTSSISDMRPLGGA